MKFPYAPEGDKRLKNWSYENEAKEMLNYINEGDVVYDIGANIGDHSTYFALNRNIFLHAFEPVPQYYEQAQKNFEYYKLKHTQIYNVGISDKVGYTDIAIDNEGSSLLDSRKNSKTEKVRVETIDNLIESGLRPPNVIKIDVEGWAEYALIGAAKTLKKYKPIIILEPHPAFLDIENIESKFMVLENIGYGITKTLLDKQREFIFEYGKGKHFSDYRSELIRQVNSRKIWAIRSEFDRSRSKEKLINLKDKYQSIIEQTPPRFSQRLIWSKLYRFFTFKWLKTK